MDFFKDNSKLYQALALYGYSKAVLETMNISQLNMLPSDVVRKNLSQMYQKRYLTLNLPHRFRHSLESGQIRDVEVFSGRCWLTEEGWCILS